MKVGCGCFMWTTKVAGSGASQPATASKMCALEPDLAVAVEAGDHVGRGHRLAVVEFDARAELERVGQVVRRLFVQLSARSRIGWLFSSRVSQRLEDVHGDVAGADRVRRHLVQAVDVGLLAEGELAAGVRALERLGRGRRPRAGSSPPAHTPFASFLHPAPTAGCRGRACAASSYYHARNAVRSELLVACGLDQPLPSSGLCRGCEGRNLHQCSDETQEGLMFRTLRLGVQERAQFDMGQASPGWSVRLMNNEGMAVFSLSP